MTADRANTLIAAAVAAEEAAKGFHLRQQWEEAARYRAAADTLLDLAEAEAAS